MARPTMPKKFHLCATAHTCLRKAEYVALSKYARGKNRSVSALMRELILAEIAMDASTASTLENA